ncbi:MAG: 3-oxoacyl-ACP reductase FabG [Gammaproteobacteria bacterium]|jgi:3-oxoacyl-[acyl-carrier protein] reductase|nr:3-oxoacyl-ACP reductase FabG [Gammaproteobacteria bacterium]MDP6617676.1 3-oxoacyl-ACP reductase FabG [Gammaproteobacteria bacterium]MDP6694969.1 3-oxoacyl-ACP reductase FabG [Gammaproteobacteria bacterium]
MSEQTLLNDRFSLEGQVALVTGASRGIGATIADDLAAAGAIVIGTATSEDGAGKIGERLARAGANGRGAVLDVADREASAVLVKEITGAEGAVTILVNNAGITRDNLLLRMKDAEWDDLIATNLTGLYHLSKCCLRGMMKAQGGRIISIASVVGVMGNAGQANYAAAKAGIIGFSKSLAREVGSRGITVNVVAPGFVQTDMTEALEDTQRDELVRQIPLNRLGRTEDISSAVLFLASSAGAYVTGETLHVNGGMYMI